MKTSIYFILGVFTLLSLSLVSCAKEDLSNPQIQEQIMIPISSEDTEQFLENPTVYLRDNGFDPANNGGSDLDHVVICYGAPLGQPGADCYAVTNANSCSPTTFPCLNPPPGVDPCYCTPLPD